MKLIERLFELKKNGTTVRTEIIAGVTTFMTMAYILAVCPSIMAQAGVPGGGVLGMGYSWQAALLAVFLDGVIGHAGVHLLSGRGREAHWIVYVLSALFIAKYALI